MSDFSDRTKLLDRAGAMTAACDLTADDGCEVCALIGEMAERIDQLDAVAADALALLDQHISEEQRRELGIRIIDRLTAVGALT